ncbi:MAG: hypothetical protein B7Z77_08895 [Acidocella sp. 20-58-15]|nr:MAG: hypothetical protein B7Z77_08895 [Acidocella sp. 20-58-15]
MKPTAFARVAATMAALALPASFIPMAAFAQTTTPMSAPIHDQLKITASEEPAWKQFAQVMRDNAAQMDAAFHSRADISTMTAPENMQSYATLAQAHADGVKNLAAAFSALYATFPEAQQKIADKLFQTHMGKAGKMKH